MTTEQTPVGVCRLDDSWCLKHGAVWFVDDDECDFAGLSDDEPCFKVPLFIGVPEDLAP